jgi:hypothetical protein
VDTCAALRVDCRLCKRNERSGYREGKLTRDKLEEAIFEARKDGRILEHSRAVVEQSDILTIATELYTHTCTCGASLHA